MTSKIENLPAIFQDMLTEAARLFDQRMAELRALEGQFLAHLNRLDVITLEIRTSKNCWKEKKVGKSCEPVLMDAFGNEIIQVEFPDDLQDFSSALLEKIKGDQGPILDPPALREDPPNAAKEASPPAAGQALCEGPGPAKAPTNTGRKKARRANKSQANTSNDAPIIVPYS